MAVTIDGDNLLFILDDTILNVSVEQHLYSEWKKWQLLDDNLRYEDAFRPDGGGPLTPGIDQGAYFFFNNVAGWRIRPGESSQTYNFTDNLAPEDSAIPIVVPTLGAFTVLINGLQPITQNVDQILDAQTISVTNLQFLVESLRPQASAFGNVWYWDPVGGNNLNSGTQPGDAFLTFAAAQAAATANNADVIFIVQTSGAALTITERLMITKNDIILRGPGSSVLFQPLDDTGSTIHVNADNVSLSGFKATSTGATPQAVIHTTGGDGLTLEDIWINGSTGNGIHGENGEDTVIKNCTIESCIDDGIHLLNAVNAKIFDNRVQRNTGYGIHLEETTTARDAWISRNVFHHNGPAGILVDTGVSMTIITKDNYFGPRPGQPGGDDIIDNGVATHNEYQEFKDMIAESIFTNVMENGETFAEQTRLMRAEAAGKIVKVGNVHSIRDAADSKNRIVANADATERTPTTIDGT